MSLAFRSGLSAAALADDPGLSNNTKTFTNPQDMRESDWSDPAEMDRSWQAALVRLPRPEGGSVSIDVVERTAMPDPGSNGRSTEASVRPRRSRC